MTHNIYINAYFIAFVLVFWAFWLAEGCVSSPRGHGYAAVYQIAGEWGDGGAPGGERGCGGGREGGMHDGKAGIGGDGVDGGGGCVAGEPLADVLVQAGGRCVAHAQESESSFIHDFLFFHTSYYSSQITIRDKSLSTLIAYPL